MHDDHALVETRIARFVAERLIPAVYRARVPADVVQWAFELRPFQLATVRLRQRWHSHGESANI